MKTCTKCKTNKEDISFNKNQGWCKDCKKNYNYDNREKLSEHQKIRISNRSEEKILADKKYHQKYYQLNKEKWEVGFQKRDKLALSEYKKWYNSTHKKERNAHDKERRNNDPWYRLRSTISNEINDILNANGGSKEGRSYLKFIPWYKEEFWEHIEKLFNHPDNLTSDGKVWMTRKNRGRYTKTGLNAWNDNDPSTWKWQLDHIIPHSDLSYGSLEHPNFKKAWELSNLRPFSAKQNQLDGATRIRHKKRNVNGQ